MAKKDKDPLYSLVCPKCSKVSWIIVGGTFDGFIKHGCIHSVGTLLNEMVKKDLEVRLKTKKKPGRVAENPNGRRPKKVQVAPRRRK